MISIKLKLKYLKQKFIKIYSLIHREFTVNFGIEVLRLLAREVAKSALVEGPQYSIY